MADNTNENVPKAGIIICSRTTYENRKHAGELNPTTVYFVIEDVTDADKCVSLYLGESRQTDIVSLNLLTNFVDKTTIEAIQEYILGSGAPAKDLLTTNKIYYWEDTEMNVMRAFMKSNTTGEIYPIYNEPVWEDIEPGL